MSAARPFIITRLGHHPLPIPIASPMPHCSYIGRNRPLPLITSCPRQRLRGPGIKRINGARVSRSPPPPRPLSVVASPTEQRLHYNRVYLAKDLGYRSTLPTCRIRSYTDAHRLSNLSFSPPFLFEDSTLSQVFSTSDENARMRDKWR